MSKTVDQRVVEMRFDNKQFESNVQTTMSSIDKLKQSLKFTGATKGLEDVSSAARKVDMSPLSNAVETVRVKFSALEVMAVTALANITNSALNAGKRIISALTIDPIMTGFQEYETQINAVQTILANTQSKGSTLDDVNAALDELNKYADQTIYNFTEMTRNIGTFTAAGVDLDKSVTSIKGIANLAAVSGSNAQQASTAMYQLSQALAAGKVQLMDWNSVVNAGMGGEIFQTALKRTATQMGYNVDELIKKYGSFRESLTKGEWLTAEVLTETLTQLSGAYTEADLIAQGYTEKQAKEITELAATAVSAATDVKTFTQLWDTLKEAAQSGWTQTWEIVIGDFEEAKELLTGISNFVGNIINESAEKRNELLEGALGNSESKWESLTSKINECGVSTEQFEARLREVAIASGMTGEEFDAIITKNGSLAKAFEKGALPIKLIIDTIKSFAKNLDSATKPVTVATDQLEHFNKVVGEVINGDFKNGEERIKRLTEAGYDQVTVQKLVNKVWERNGKTWDNVSVSSEELTEIIGTLSSKELESIGYTKEQADALKELAAEAEKTGTPINDLIESLNKPSGRELIIDSFKNVLGSLYKAIVAVQEAWRDIFPPMTSEQLYGIIEGIHSLTESLVLSDENAGKITRTFKGLFAIIDIITTIVGGGFKAVWKVISTVLGVFNLNVLDVTASLGDAAVSLRDFLFKNDVITKGLEALANGLVSAGKAIKGWIDAFLELPFVQNAIENLKNSFSGLYEAGKDAITGFQNGLKEGIKSVPELLMELGRKLLDAIKDVLGIHSPSTEMKEVGKNAIQGLIDGLGEGVSKVVETLKGIGQKIIEVLGDINWGSVIGIAFTGGMLFSVKKLSDGVAAITAPLEGIGDVLSGVGEVLSESAKSISKVIKNVSKVVKGFANVLNAKAFDIKAAAIKNIAIAIAILAGSVFLLAQLDSGKLWESIGAIAALAAVMGLLTLAIGKSNMKETLSFGGFALAIVGISAGLLLMASALKKISSIDPEKWNQTIDGFVGIVIALMGIIAVYGQLVKGDAANNIGKVGGMMIKISVAMLLMVGVMKIISGMESGDLIKGGAGILAFVGIVALLSLVTKLLGKNTDKLGGMMIKLSAALILMTVAVKLISGMSASDLKKGGAAILAFVGIVTLLALVTRIGGEPIKKLGSTLIAMSASMLIMTAVIKLISGMSASDLRKGGAAILAFVGIIALLTAVTKLGGKTSAKLGATLLAMSASIGILAGVAILLGLIDVNDLAKGVVAVGALGTIMSLMVVATKYASDCKGTLIVLTVAVGVLAAAAAGLSFIDPIQLAGATAALSIVIGMFALLVRSTKDVQGSMGVLIVMTVAVGLLGGILYLLASLPIESTITAAASLSVLLISLSASLLLISKMNKVSATSYIAIGVMTLVLGAVGGILYLLGGLPVGTVMPITEALVILLGSLLAATAVLGVIGKVLSAGTVLQGVAGLAIVVAGVGGIMAALAGLNALFPGMEEFLETGLVLLEKIGYGLGSFIGNIIGGFAAGVMSGLPDIGTSLSQFMINATPFIDGAKTIDASMMEGVKSLAGAILILTGANLLEQLTSWLTGGSSLSSFAQELVPFGEAMVAFSNSIVGLDANLVSQAALAGKALAEMATTIPNSGGVVAFFTGENDMEEFGEQLVPFGEAITEFSKTVEGVNVDNVEKAAAAGQMMADMAETIPNSGGVVGFFTGENDMAKFGEQLVPFGEAITEFSTTVEGINVDNVEKAAAAGQMMSDMAETIPNSGGVVAFFTGENDLIKFGEQLIPFGEAITEFSTIVKDIDVLAVSKAASAGSMMTKLNETIPNTGGLVDFFTGDKDLAAFGETLVPFGEALADYSKEVKDVDANVVLKSTQAAEALTALQEKMPTDKLFKDEVWLDEFGKMLSDFSDYYLEFYEDIDQMDVTKIMRAITQIDRLRLLGENLLDFDGSGLTNFGKALKTLGENGIEDFKNAFINADSEVKAVASNMLNSFIDSANSRKSDVTTTFTSLVNDVLTAIKKKTDEFGTVGKSAMTKFIDGIQSKQTDVNRTVSSMITSVLNSLKLKVSDFRLAGLSLAAAFASGIQLISSTIKNLFTNPINAALTVINSKRTDFKNAGKNLVMGFAEGIDQYTYLVKDEAREMANDAYNAAMKALDAHSPSRKFFKVGSYVVLGFANGIESNGDAVTDSVESMANRAVFNTQSAIAKLVDRIEQGIDTQPTIRPVLDLSDVEAGASRLNVMFSRNRALTVSSRMNDVTSRRIQNGVESFTPSFQLTQNNYSPKALSRIDIYRQTKNLFSTLERTVTK